MPSQVVEAKEAGAAGVLGTIANESGPRGAPVLSSYAAAIGLDCPVEVSLKLHCTDEMLLPAATRISLNYQEVSCTTSVSRQFLHVGV